MPAPRIVNLKSLPEPQGAPTVTAYRGVPLSITLALDRTRTTATGWQALIWEIRNAQLDDEPPLASFTQLNPTGPGPFTADFTGAQTNQDLSGAAARLLWLVGYFSKDAGETLDVVYTGRLNLLESGVSQMAAAPPNVVGPLSRAAADLIYHQRGVVLPLADVPLLDATAHAADQIDRRIAGLTANDATKKIFSTAVHTGTPAYVRSLTCWARDIDLTGVGVWNSQYGTQIGFTAITARHVVICHHATIATGTTMRWVTSGNVIVERALISSVQIGSTDARVGLLSADLPATISPAGLAPSSEAYGSRCPLLYLDQEKKALIGAIDSIDTNSVSLIAPSGGRAAFFEQAIAGDSGHGWFLVAEGRLKLVSHFLSADPFYAATGPNYPDRQALLQTAMDGLVSGYTLARATGQSHAWAAVTGKPVFGTASLLDTGTAIGNVPIVTGSGKLDPDIIPEAAGGLEPGDFTANSENTFFGEGAGFLTTPSGGGGEGRSNAGFGASALAANFSGQGLSAFGHGAMFSNTTGSYNTAVGQGSLATATTANFNTAVGTAALISTNGIGNIAVGGNAGAALTTGNYNTIIGTEAGNGDNQKTDAINTIAIGNGAFTTADNQTVIGNDLTETTVLRGKIVLPECPTYGNDAAADADSGLPSGAFYRTTAGGRAVFRKP